MAERETTVGALTAADVGSEVQVTEPPVTGELLDVEQTPAGPLLFWIGATELGTQQPMGALFSGKEHCTVTTRSAS